MQRQASSSILKQWQKRQATNPQFKIHGSSLNKKRSKAQYKIILLKECTMSATQFHSQGSVALHPGANTKIRATVAAKKKDERIVACRLAAQPLRKSSLL